MGNFSKKYFQSIFDRWQKEIFKEKNHLYDDSYPLIYPITNIFPLYQYNNEIWVGTIINKKATHKDVLLVEKMLTSYFVAEGELLNVINKKLPEESLYLINEWIHYKRNSECLRLPKISIGNMMPDVIIYKKDNYSDEYKLFVSNKLKITD